MLRDALGVTPIPFLAISVFGIAVAKPAMEKALAAWDNPPRPRFTTAEESVRSEKVMMLVFLVSVAHSPLSAQTSTDSFGHGDSKIPLRPAFPSLPGSGVGSNSHAGGTVVVGAALSDGLVLAADSRMVSSIGGVVGYKIVSDSVEKIHDVGSDAIAVYGEAFLLGRDIGSYIQDFGLQVQKAPTRDVSELAKKFSEYFGSFYDRHVQQQKTAPNVGFLVAGYGADGVGRIIQIEFPSGRDPLEVHNTRSNTGIVWRGQTDVIDRLIKGFDRLLGSLPIIEKLNADQRQQLTNEIARLEYNVPYQYLMLQDGVDLSLFLVQTTVDTQRFSFGTLGSPGATPGVGGAVDVLAITPFKLEWIKKKTLTSK